MGKDTVYSTRDRARRDVNDYIEMFYNSRRLHSFIKFKKPNDFEKRIDFDHITRLSNSKDRFGTNFTKSEKNHTKLHKVTQICTFQTRFY